MYGYIHHNHERFLLVIMTGTVYIVGSNNIAINSTSQLQAVNGNGGSWASTDNTVATVDNTGLVTAIGGGVINIVYTQTSPAATINYQFSVYSSGLITNGFNPTQVLEALQNEVLWPSQGSSNSGRYFTDFHPICDETILKDLAQVGQYPSYRAFISSLNNSVILDCVNSVYNKPQLINRSQLVFARSDIMLVEQPVQNETPPQFVGLKFQLAPGDYRIKVSNLMLFFNEAISFPVYLYNDFNEPPMYKMMVSTLANQQTIINLRNNIMFNYLTPSTNKGGIWYFGYYQSDIIAASPTAKAIYYPITINTFNPVVCWSYSAPTFIDGMGQLNFQRQIVGANNLTYGMNVEMSTYIDDTNNIVENPSLWGNVIGLKMVCKVIEICKYSYRSGGTKRAVDAMGGLDSLNKELNGSRGDWTTGAPKIVGVIEKVNDAIQTVKQGFEPQVFGSVGLI